MPGDFQVICGSIIGENRRSQLKPLLAGNYMLKLTTETLEQGMKSAQS